MGCCGGEKVEDNQPEKYEPDFKGPVKNRGCTDILCLAVFLAVITGWIVIAVFGFVWGDPNKIYYPTDTTGRICGQGKLSDRPYLFFFDLSKCANPAVVVTGCPTPQVCVSKCPEYFMSTLPYTTGVSPSGFAKEEEDKQRLVCKYHITNDTLRKTTIKTLIQKGDCASLYYPTSSVAGRCLPKIGAIIETSSPTRENSTETMKAAKDLLTAFIHDAKSTAQNIVTDFSETWWIMLVGLCFAMVLSFIWIILVRYVGGFMVWFSLFFVIIILGAVSGYSFYKYTTIKDLEATNGETDETKSLRRSWMASGIIFASILLIDLLIMIFLRSRIRLAIALIAETSKAIGSIPGALFFPIVPFILYVGVLAFFAAVTIYLASTGANAYVVHSSVNSTASDKCVQNCGAYNTIDFRTYCDPNNFTCSCPSERDAIFTCDYLTQVNQRGIHNAQIYNILALIWMLFFIDAFAQMVLAGAISSWYWAFNKPHDIPTFPVLSSICRTLTYHVGSLAFGSLIITIVRIIRYGLEYLEKKVKDSEGTCGKIVFCCCRCCFWCLESFLKFINKNAYIMIAVHGKNFCTSARKAFNLLLRNVIRVAVLDNVTTYLFFTGKLLVVGGSGIVSYAIFSGQFTEFQPPPLNYYFLPVLVIVLGSFLIASAFFGVYEMAVDTIFLCFLEDSERNDGSPEKPYFMSKKLMKILGKKNKEKKK